MLKNEKIIKENFFGMNIRDQRRLYATLIKEMVTIKNQGIDTSYLANFPNIFSSYLERKEELYKIREVVQKLNKHQTDIIFKKNKLEFLHYATFRKYTQAIGLTLNKFFNYYAFEYNNAFFEFDKVETVTIMEFINSFKTAKINEKLKFLEEFRDCYEILEKMPYELPDEKLISEDFDDVIKRIFGTPALEWYKALLPHQKIDFLKTFGHSIVFYYESSFTSLKTEPKEDQDYKKNKKNNNKLRYVNKCRR